MTNFANLTIAPAFLRQLMALPDGVEIVDAGVTDTGGVRLTLSGPMVPGVRMPGLVPDVSLPQVRPVYEDVQGVLVVVGWERYGAHGWEPIRHG